MYKDYNSLRQHYVLEAAMKHFQLRMDDPAPLYGKNLLDAGCGESTIAQFLALSGADITAIDCEAHCIAKAEEEAQAFGAPIRFVHAAVENLINDTKKFDIILAMDLLEDASEPEKLLWVLKQLLAPGGMIILSHITRSPKAWFMHIFLSSVVYHRTRRGLATLSRFHTPRQLTSLCHHVGLTLKDVQGLRLSTSKERWKLSPRVDTRYMATATL